jgi:hypothetical protein
VIPFPPSDHRAGRVGRSGSATIESGVREGLRGKVAGNPALRRPLTDRSTNREPYPPIGWAQARAVSGSDVRGQLGWTGGVTLGMGSMCRNDRAVATRAFPEIER